MRFTIFQYARALHDALENATTDEDRAKMIRRFLLLLRIHSASGNLSRILSAVEKFYCRSRGLRKIAVETSSGLSNTARGEIRKIFGENIVLDEVVLPELLAGIRITVDDELLIDASGKRQLEYLFR